MANGEVKWEMSRGRRRGRLQRSVRESSRTQNETSVRRGNGRWIPGNGMPSWASHRAGHQTTWKEDGPNLKSPPMSSLALTSVFISGFQVTTLTNTGGWSPRLRASRPPSLASPPPFLRSSHTARHHGTHGTLEQTLLMNRFA